MTTGAQGDVVPLVTAGAVQPNASWRGGEGLLAVGTGPTAGNIAITLPDGTTANMKDYITGTVISLATANAMYNVCLPSCRLNVTGFTGTGNVWLIGIR